MYIFYLDDLVLPITPAEINTKIKGNNKTYELANSGEINLIKYPGLTTYTFDFDLLHDLSNINYKASDTSPEVVFNFLEQAKIKKKVVKFTVVRSMRGSTRFPISQKVTVEDYTINEDADNNSDFKVSIELKQFRPYRTKHLADKKKQRPTEPAKNNSKSKTPPKKVTTKSKLKKVEILHDLNIRQGAGIKNKKVGHFRTGDKPVVYGSMKDSKGKVWYKIKHSAAKNGWGYISSNPKYVKDYNGKPKAKK